METPTRYNSPTVLQAAERGELVKYEDYAALNLLCMNLQAQLRTHTSTRNDAGEFKVSPRDEASFIEIKERILSICTACDFGATFNQLKQNIPSSSPASIRLCVNSLKAQHKIVEGLNYRYEAIK
jgi:hypothetical protein